VRRSVQKIIIGSLLGDGWLNPMTPTQKSSYRVKYSDRSIGYLTWIHDQVAELKPSELKSIPKYSQHLFYTESRTDLGEFRKLFYPNEGEKRVPQNIKSLLKDPLSLAVWFMDDGTLDFRDKYHRNALFATHCFSFNDCNLLSDMLRENFGLKVSVCKCQMRGKMYYRLYVYSESMKLFEDIIKPFMHKDYAYKIRNCQGQQQR